MNTYFINDTLNTERTWISNAPATEKQVWLAKKLMAENNIQFIDNRDNIVYIDNKSKTTVSDIIDFIMNKKFKNCEIVAEDETTEITQSIEIKEIIEIIEDGRISNLTKSKFNKNAKKCDMCELSSLITLDQFKKFSGYKTNSSLLVKSFINAQKEQTEDMKIDKAIDKAFDAKEIFKQEQIKLAKEIQLIENAGGFVF